ncbi:hypothetical protein CRE_09448 [Caenorhabditis remanei]|uniref:EGF-like domain-containing protein n=1 Tax=Caenorhabditis remanei TaxID=31234 RepID=E3LIX1_CAERE|nr:hypothetical protein CRE_09448 [Caenorhabditis remanei]
MRFSVPDKNRCACAPGWYDKYCGLRGCMPPNEDHVNIDLRSLIIVFNTKTSMKSQMTKDANGVYDNWIESFIVYGFVNVQSQLIVQSKFMYSADDVVNFLNSFTLYDGDDTQPVITAVQAAQQTFPKQRSHATVLVFTDSPSSDATPWSHRFTDQNPEQLVLQISLLWKSRYTFFLSLPAGTDYTSNGVDVYRRLALTNHGDTFFIQDINDFTKVLLSVIGSQYYSENVAVAYGKTDDETLTTYVDNEGDIVYFLITIDPSTSKFYQFSKFQAILILESTLPTMAGVNLYADGPSYRVSILKVSYILSAKFQLYTRPSKIGDTVTISNTPGSKYNYRMFLQSKRTLMIFYNDDMYIDVGNGMPVIGVGMSATMQTYNFPDFESSSYELRTFDGRFLREKIYSYVRPQLDCTFLYGFPSWDSGNCPPGPATSVHVFYYNGYKQQRVSTAYCITSNHNPQDTYFHNILKSPQDIYSMAREKHELQMVNEISQDDVLQCKERSIDAINDPRLKEAKQLIFILEQHMDNAQIYKTLAKEINQIIYLTNATNADTFDWEFTLISHDSAESHVILSAYNPIDFGEKFQKFVTNLQLLNNLDNTMGLLSIVQAQKITLRPTAQVYYFTNQAVKTVQNVARTWDIVSRNMEVNFITIADGVTTEIFALPKELELIQKMTNGRIIPITKTETTLLPLFGDMIGVTALTTDNEQYVSQFQTSKIFQQTIIQNCHDTPLVINGFFEDGADYSVVQVVGTGLKTFQMQDSNGAIVGVTDYITYQNPNFVSMRVDKSKFASGVWKISALTATGGCQITVRHRTTVGMLLGFTSSNTDDATVTSQIITQRSKLDSLPLYAAMKVTDGIIPTNLEIRELSLKRVLEMITKFPEIVNRKRYDQPQSYTNSTVIQRDSNSCTYNLLSESIVVPKNELTTWTVTAYNTAGKLLLHRIFYYYQHLPSDASVCHGGETDKFGRCICPYMYTGEYCWDRLCVPPAT